MMEIVSIIADITGILGAVFAFYAWMKSREIKAELDREKKRQNKEISIVLECDDNSQELPVKLHRSALTRAEVLGRIGMIPIKSKEQKRFSLKYTFNPHFLNDIDRIADGYGEDSLRIPCSKKEFEQFDLSQ